MRRIRLIIEYDGTNYVGWQVQPNGVSIQQRLNEALFAVTGECVSIHGSGRTDSGVHARAQVAHFDTAVRMAADKFAIAMNMHLPRDIRVLYAEETDDHFHARFSAKEKSYRYTVQLGPHARVFTRDTALHIHTPLDIDRMNIAAADCIGEHDFSAFMSVGTAMENTVRTIFVSHWTQEENYLRYDVTGNGFLYNMVRILVGTMLEVGVGKCSPGIIARAMTSGNRADSGATAPPQGLTMMRVRYPDFDTDEILKLL
ncbi:MAG: tRNA pseudouridine(38-40) synthase TruA [Clostridia bacterium]